MFSYTSSIVLVGVKFGVNIKIAVSEPVSGVSRTTVRLKNLDNGKWLSAKVTYDKARGVITLNPAWFLRSNTKYQVVISKGITDAAGNKLPPYSFKFKTRPWVAP